VCGDHEAGVEAVGRGGPAAIPETDGGGEVITRINAARVRLRLVARAITASREDLLNVHESLPTSPGEHSPEDVGTEPDVSTEIRSVIKCVLSDHLELAIRDLLEASEYPPSCQHAVKGGRFPQGLDIHAAGEETRRALYDVVVKDNFMPQAQDDPEDAWVPPYTAEEAGLEVFFEHGRWFASWMKLEEKEDLPEAARRELLVLDEDPAEPGRLVYRGF